MPILSFQGESYTALEGETVLDCLTRHGVRVPSSCRAGVCQSCLVKAEAGPVPASAQIGIKASRRRQGWLLACQCPALPGLALAPCDDLQEVEARVERVEELTPVVSRIWLRVPGGFHFEPGQFVTLVRPEDGLARPYSIANLPGSGLLELHVTRHVSGRMSRWLTSSAGAAIRVRGPSGECFYTPAQAGRPLLLAGTGTGLAPLLGVVRSALAAGHRGPIRLVHGSLRSSELYARAELDALERQHPTLRVSYSVLEDDLGLPGIDLRSIERVIFDDAPALGGSSLYFCGDPDLVRALKKQAFLGGASLDRIHSDPFLTALNEVRRSA